MRMFLNNALDVRSQWIILTTKTTLFLLLVLFVSVMRECCRDIFKASLKYFLTLLSLCPLPIKSALYSFKLLLNSASVEQILPNLKGTRFCFPKIEG